MKTKTNFGMIIGMSLVIASMTGIVYAEKPIGIFSLQSEIETSESVLVTGFVDSVSFYKPVKLEVIDPNEVIIFSPNIQFSDDGKFSWLFHPPLGKFDVPGTYTIIASHEDLVETAQIQFTVTEKSSIENPLSTSQEIVQSIKIDSERLISTQPQQVFSSESTENQDSSTMITAIALSIAGIVSGIVIWMKITYAKPMIQK